jgi:hypothetical protein
MALFQKRFSSFGREDRASGVMALLKADSIIIRLIVFVVLGGIFYLVVQATHKAPRVPVETGGEQQQSAPAVKTPATK